jgi:hypothetical protein
MREYVMSPSYPDLPQSLSGESPVLFSGRYNYSGVKLTSDL